MWLTHVVGIYIYIYSAYRKYIEEGGYDRRSEEKKKRNGMKLYIRRQFPVLLLTLRQLHT
jgi:hypothetical protein